MDCDEPHLMSNEKMQPIQWTGRPISALVAASSLQPTLSHLTTNQGSRLNFGKLMKVLVLAQFFIFVLGSLHLLFSFSHCCSILHMFDFLHCHSTPRVFIGLFTLLFVSSYVVQLFALLFNPSHCNSTTSNCC